MEFMTKTARSQRNSLIQNGAGIFHFSLCGMRGTGKHGWQSPPQSQRKHLLAAIGILCLTRAVLFLAFLVTQSHAARIHNRWLHARRVCLWRHEKGAGLTGWKVTNGTRLTSEVRSTMRSCCLTVVANSWYCERGRIPLVRTICLLVGNPCLVKTLTWFSLTFSTVKAVPTFKCSSIFNWSCCFRDPKKMCW